MSTSTATPEVKSSGLEGMIAGKTTIASVLQDKLIYRGYTIEDLAANATFEEISHVLLVGHKASASELAAFEDELKSEREIPELVTETIKKIAKLPNTVPMDTLRTAVSMLGHLDPQCQDNSAEANLAKAKRLLAQIPTVIGHMQNVIDGKDIVAPHKTLSHAANLLYMMSGTEPTAEYAKVMDVSLILYAEHDFNASTFTSRVISATLSDMHGAVTGAIAALKGPLHGGANEAAMDMIKNVGTLENVAPYMQKAFANKDKIMGFGHRVYKGGDHRAPILHAEGRKIAESLGGEALRWFEVGEAMQKIMLDEKNIHPNVDFPCGLTYFVMGIPVPQYTPIFVASRITGWAAHIMEQHANNRLIRPVAEYVGEGIRPW